MKRFLVLLLGLLMVPAPGWAIPQSFFTINGLFFGPVIPATPRFNADLTEEFLIPENWERDALPGPWEEPVALQQQQVRRMSASPVLFGAVPDSVSAYSDESGLTQLSITYLDAGKFFGFKYGGEKSHEDRQAGAEKRSEFAQHFHRLANDLRQRLQQGCGPGKMAIVGRSHLLRTAFTDYRWEDFVLRLAVHEGHSVALSIMRADRVVTSYLDDALSGLTPEQRTLALREKVELSEYGDVQIAGIPMFDQGFTPFCGIHSLAMVGHYYGLRLNADSLAAGAEFLNTGSARGSRVLDLYHAMAEEIGMDVQVSSRFDFDRAREALREGRPIVVWRRVSKEREDFHTEFAERFARNSSVRIPTPSKAMKEGWPPRDKKGSPSHATVISGFNEERGEVIFTEPWGEDARDRRMLVEEMEATVYAAFYFGF